MRPTRPRFPFASSRLAFALVLLASPARAQLVGGQWDLLQRLDGGSAGDNFGFSVAAAGDVDGDGVGDLLIGAIDTNPGGLQYAGSAFVYSGATGGLLHRFDGAAAYDGFGFSVAGPGDLDGDGFADLLIGANGAAPGGRLLAGSVYAYSGADGSLLHRFDGPVAGDRLGGSVAGTGDLDGDALPDLILGANGADPGGRIAAGSAFVVSGATGLLLHRFDGPAAGDALGNAVADAGDVDGDGVSDLVVGAWKSDAGGATWSGSAYVYSGAHWGQLHAFHGSGSYDALGYSVAGAGDLDGDGLADLVLGAMWADPGGLVNAGSVYVHSGADGSLLYRFDGAAAGDNLGISLAGVSDVDGDRVPDLLLGASWADPGGLPLCGSAELRSGASGELLVRLDGEEAGDYFGSSVAGAGDLDGDGLAELLVGAYEASPGGLQEAGAAYLYSLDPFLHPDADVVSASGGSSVQFSLAFPLAEAGVNYALLASLAGTGPTSVAGLDIPLTHDGLFNLCTSGNAPAALVGAYGTLNANAQALATLQADPALAPAIGQTVHFAAVTFDTGPTAGRMSSIARYVQIVP
jgi:hypothetical protein